MNVLSASQIEVWKTCPRRWAHIYLLGKREKSTDATTAGTIIHALLEKYLRDGTPIDTYEQWKQYAVGAIAHDMCQHLPPAGSCPDVELKLDLVVNGIAYTGRIDLAHMDASGFKVINDFKSSSNLKYAKSEATLRSDVQALIYARWLDADGFLQWTYGQTKGEVKSKRVRLKVLKDDVAKAFDEIVTPLAKEILDAYEHRDINKTAQNFGACMLYPPNGCPNKLACHDHTDGKIKFNMSSGSEKKMSLIDKIKAGKAAATVDLINPPITKPLEQVIAEIELTPHPANRLPQVNLAVIDALDKALPYSAPEPELPKKPRKRKAEAVQILSQSGVEVVTLGGASELAAELDSIPAALDKLPQELARQASEANKGMLSSPDMSDSTKPIDVLYVNCVPCYSHPNLVYAHELITRAAQTVCDDVQLHHIKLAEFGKGGGMLAAELTAQILKMPPGFSVVLSARTPEGRDVELAMCALSKTVIMGV